MIKLYHGSNVNIEHIDLSKSHPSKSMTGLNVTPQEFEYMKTQVTARMIQILVEEQGLTLEEAFDRVYTSPVYEKLSNPNTGLFFQSPRYVLSYL